MTRSKTAKRRRRGATHECPPLRPDAQDEADLAAAQRARRRARCRIEQDRLPDRASAAASAAAGPDPKEPCRRGGRLRPYRRARHEGRRRSQSRAGRRSHPHAVDGAEQMASVEIEFGGAVGLGRAGSPANCLPPTSTSSAPPSPKAISRACSPPAAGIRCAMAAPCCIRCRSVTPSTGPTASAIRAACWAAGSASTCTWPRPISRRREI